MGYPNEQSNPAAAIPVWIAPAPGTKATNITTETGTLVKTGAGIFTGIIVNTGASGAQVGVHDGLNGAGTTLATYDASNAMSLAFAIPFTTGLFVVTFGSAAADITILSQ